MKRVFFYILFFLLIYRNGFASGIPGVTYVLDIKSAENFAQSLNNEATSLGNEAEMLKNLGTGDLTPSTVSWIGNWYQKCGGGKYVLPDWFPKPPNLLNSICSDDNQRIKDSVNWYKENYLVLSTDSTPTAQKKLKAESEAAIKVRAMALSKSVDDMARETTESSKVINQYQEGLKKSKDIVEVSKVQTQVLISVLSELQKINYNQALIIQVLSYKN